MKRFNITYLDEIIRVEAGDHYRLVFPDGRWLVIEKYPDDTKTTPVNNENISYSTAFVWVVEDKPEGPGWLNREQLQVVGELVRRKDQELENNC